MRAAGEICLEFHKVALGEQADAEILRQVVGGNAIARQAETFQGRSISRDHLWDRDFFTHTLPKTDAADAEIYLKQQIVSKNDQLALNFI